MMPLEILLVEDNEGDARLMREALLEVNKDVHLHVVPDGIEAMAFVRFQGVYLDVPRPDLIVMDLNMPRMNGMGLLAGIKTDPWLKSIPIIVLTTSVAEEDIVQSYELMANCYLNKPEKLEEFESLVNSLNDFWLNRVKLRKRIRPARLK